MPEFDFDQRYAGKVRDGKFYSRAKSRFAQLAKNNLGIRMDGSYDQSVLFYRDPLLHQLDKYYENTQYDHLEDWDNASCQDDYIAVRKRKPRIIYSYGKVLSSRVASKLVGDKNFPTMKVDEDPDTTEFLKVLINSSMLRSRLLEPIKRTVATGSAFVRFYIVENAIKIEWFKSKYCYPEFSPAGELISVEVRYVYEDQTDLDAQKNPKKKWYKMILGTMTDILFDNPEYKPGATSPPEFQVVSRVDHELGFVQGHWFRTCEDKHSPDGYGLLTDLMDFIDEVNYNLSQSSEAVSYNQDPQLTIKNMDEEELSELIRSSQKAWNLGREGEANFLESNLDGVKVASELRDKVRLGVQDISRVVMMDPEKMVAHAQSGRALEVLHGPFVELLNEIRPFIELGIKALLVKMALAVLITEEKYGESPITIPAGYAPKSLDVQASWPPVFPLTMTDMKEMLSVATAATSANIFSREWAARWLAGVKEFGVEDIETELQKVATQPVINPFGGF
jgi:hypothetical protein